MRKKVTKSTGVKHKCNTTKSSQSRKVYLSSRYPFPTDCLLELSIDDINAMETLSILPAPTLCQLRAAGMASVLFVLKGKRTGQYGRSVPSSMRLINAKLSALKKYLMIVQHFRQISGCTDSADGYPKGYPTDAI